MRVEVYPGKEVVVEFDRDLTFECVDGCTWCCHRGVVLYDTEFAELDAHADPDAVTTSVDEGTKIGRENKGRDEHVDVDGRACYFLSGEGRCTLEGEYDWKPARCSVFPLEVTVEDGDFHVDVRADAERNCEGLNVSERRVLDHLDAFLPERLWALSEPATDGGR